MAEEPGGETALDLNNLSFEQAFQHLGELAESLDAGGLTLAEATDRYEQGMVLVRRCNQLLDATELRITNLKEAYSQGSNGPGSLEDEDPDTDEAAQDELPF